MTSYLDNLYRPKHVAFVGFSEERSKSGARFLSGLINQGYDGKVSLLGKRDADFDGYRVYGEICDLPTDIDLAFCMLGANTTSEILPKVASHGVPMGVVYTSGFAEMGGDGVTRQDRLIQDCRDRGMRLLGPNCLGYFYLPSKINLTGPRQIRPGPLGLISQSGNVASTLWDQCHLLEVGFSAFISVGNQADIPIHDHIEYLGNDEATKVIMLYIEGLADGQGEQFVEICRKVSKVKPIVALKGGKLEGGMRAANSHTASLSASSKVYSAMFKECGIVEVRHLEHMLPIAEVLFRCPPMRGDQVAIVGSGGGHSTIGTDEVEAAGLSVPEFSPGVQQYLGSRLPVFAPKRNPVDMTGAFENDPSLFAQLSDAVLEMDTHFDGVLNYGLYGLYRLAENSPHTYVSAAKVLGDIQRKHQKPFIFYTPYAYKALECFTALREEGIPCFYDLRIAALGLASLRQRHQYLQGAAVDDGVGGLAIDSRPRHEPSSQGSGLLSEASAVSILEGFGIEFPRLQIVSTEKDLLGAADNIGFPVVLKAVLNGVPHKSEVGAVVTGIPDATSLTSAAKSMKSNVAAALGTELRYDYMVIEDLGRNRELFVGVRKDRLLGRVGVIGFGGVLAEVVNDTQIVMLPATPRQVKIALEELKTAAMWRDFRGKGAVSPDDIARMLNKLAAALDALVDRQSIECNPVVVHGNRLVPVDAWIE